MNNIKKFQDYEVNEGRLSNIVISLSTLVSVGLSRIDAQQIKDNQEALSVIDTCHKYNQLVNINHNIDRYESKEVLKRMIDLSVTNSDTFMKNYIQFLPDKTVVLKPTFIKGLDLSINPETKQFGFHYTLKF